MKRALALATFASAIASAAYLAAQPGGPTRSTSPVTSSNLTGSAIGSGSGSAIVLTPAQQAVADTVSAGVSLKIDGANGSIYVWQPPGYHPDGAATVVYVHGYYTTVDVAWLKHQLPEQFAMASINAQFIAVEAPNGNRPPVNYRSLVDVLQQVDAATGKARPTGPVVAMGHSGAFRTLIHWLDEPILDTIILLDALYSETEQFADWFAMSPTRRLITVGDDTLRWTEDIAIEIAQTHFHDLFPSSYAGWPEEALRARHLYIRSQFSHMALVTNGVAIPLLVRLIPAEALGTPAWSVGLGSLPPPPDLGSGSSAR